MSHQTILITGSTDGLGKLVALGLAQRRATMLLHGRDQQRLEAARQEIKEASGNDKLQVYRADFSSLDEVRELSEKICADQGHLDVLINNAGIGAGARSSGREKSRDGYELRFAVNYLSHFLLTHQLLPLLRRSIPSRIVNVASIGQNRIDFDDVMLDRGYDGLRAYRQSKLAQVMFTFDLAEELRGSGVTVNCLHPASLMNTKMVLETDYFGDPMSSVKEGAYAAEYLATAPDLDGVTGEYFDGTRRARANPQAYDKEARRRLRTLSEQLAKLKEPDE
jgi:NAD(P)-dependent dehydrogenase (short-subunit alcohol dehydrogenase family)